MSFEAIQSEIAKWDHTALRRLIAYAAGLQRPDKGQDAATASPSLEPASAEEMDEIEAVLARRYDGQPEDAERHDVP